MQDVTMKASGEKMHEQEEEEEVEEEEKQEDEMIESAAEFDDDSQASPSPNPDQCDFSKKFRPIRQRLPKSQRKNSWHPTDLTETRSDWQPQMQQTKPQENQESTPQTQPQQSQLTTQPQTNKPKQSQPELGVQHTTNGDFIEIRCLVERLEEDCEEPEGNQKRCLVLDAVTPVPGSVPLRDLVEAVLNAHHFESTDVLGAKGSILPNSKWQAIQLDDVALDSSATVGDVVSGIETSSMMLKITLPSCEQKLREALLQFLLSIVSFDLFTKTNCPLDKTMLDQIRVGDKKLNPSKNKLSAFKRWVKDEFKCGDQIQNGVHRSKRGAAIPEFKVENGTNPRPPSPKTLDLCSTSPRFSTTTFDPFTEITKLNAWFELNPDPSLTDLLMYVDRLNCQPYRRSHRVTLNSLVSWFVEARAKSNLHHPQQFQSSILRTSSPNNEKKRKSCDCDSKSKESVVPCLPNRNAIYVVDPLLADSSDSESAVVVQPTDDGDFATETTRNSLKCSVDVTSTDIFEKSSIKSDENHNWSNPPVVDVATDQATDLSLVKRLHPPSTKSWNWKPVALLDPTGRHPDKRTEKDTREYEVSSGSSSPKAITDNALPASFYPSYPLATMSGLPIHPNSFHAATIQILQQRALYNFSHPVFVPQPYDIENMGSPGSGNEENDRRKRSRVFIDPTTEIPRLEQWYVADTHPSAQTIEQYTDELNKAEYRQRFPKLEPKNVQLWFKNHRAKMKRLRMEQVKCESINGSNGFLGH